ncbi:Glyoxylase, beta-lactamase superfamily II [Marinobacter daqiaonensis]|uniref:Glyoxylase, beta-lactamase superfamily II n=1 Tax=Marinobacter daqiaonensis TaxID=650891 RepID=A0A1I6I9N2_9GAMM|nr:MBL fold metallo-hydrolase [Marinobacter daqiaonensis]SFR63391.1 Glyoxylase, beta-lactamase superfamily II [Marinobacter daqiaonensis]
MEIRPAATLAITRDSSEGLEVLLLQRTWDATFMPGFYVFPGGAVDDADRRCEQWLTGGNDASVSHDMGVESGGSHFMTAAIRESFEEAGVMLALDGNGETLKPDHPVFAERDAVFAGDQTLGALCHKFGLSLPLDRLAYLSHWVTPPGPPRRFDTRFFVAALPEGQSPTHDRVETIDHVWLTPEQAMVEHRKGTRLFASPTLRTLRILAGFDTTEELIRYARSQPPEAEPDKPWPAIKAGKPVSIEPGTPPFDEVRKVDPEGLGQARAEIIPERPVQLADAVVRLTCPNPSAMTGPGTNTYLLGVTGGEWTVIDPGPAEQRHLANILEITGGRIGQVLCTHTHPDHSPGAAVLKHETGAIVRGMHAPAEDPIQDHDFAPDQVPVDGDRIDTAAGTLKVLFTPGHASNHLCFLLEKERMLFAGDHIMQGSTVVINPPDGDMKDYLESLDRLLLEDIRWIAPAHGFLIGKVQSVIDWLTTHRLTRERKIANSLREHGPGTLEELVKHAYDDVPASIHGLAKRSLLAHLIKLRKEDRARESDDVWQAMDDSQA